MQKNQTQNTLTVWVFASDETRARRYTAAKLHGTSPRGEQSSTEAVAEVQMDNRKGSSWVRNRNNEGQCDRFVNAEKSEEWMARSPVWPDDVIASETASRHQPMNWRDSIWAQTRSRGRRYQSVKATQCWVTYERKPLTSAMRSKAASGRVNRGCCVVVIMKCCDCDQSGSKHRFRISLLQLLCAACFRFPSLTRAQ